LSAWLNPGGSALAAVPAQRGTTREAAAVATRSDRRDRRMENS
jgi:hypothetical protein